MVEQDVVLTVPASFDEVARTLTLEATRSAGFQNGTVRLLEEPQAAFLDWSHRAGDAGLRALLRSENERTAAPADTIAQGVGEVLVCDVGGGTTDLSLMRVSRDAALPSHPFRTAIRRVAVSEHTLLGGDNLDIASAHRLEPLFAESEPDRRLTPWRFSQLVLACRQAKEALLAQSDDSPSTGSDASHAEEAKETSHLNSGHAGDAGGPREVMVTLLAPSARLLGNAQRVPLRRIELDEILDLFFPKPDASFFDAIDLPRKRGGLIALGLPYAADPAITRHVARFLARHATPVSQNPPPLFLLLNGGVFHAAALASRLAEAVSVFTGRPVRLLPNLNPDLAVARGAVAHGMAMRGIGPRIGGGAAHGYYLGLAPVSDAPGEGPARDKRQAVCVIPRGAEPSARNVAKGRTLALTLGRTARFDVYSSDRVDLPGDVVEIDDQQFIALPPLVTAVAAGVDHAREVRVHLEGELTELGTLELSCVEESNAFTGATDSLRFLLAFELRSDLQRLTATPSMSAPARASSDAKPGGRASLANLADACARIDRVFGKAMKLSEVDAREAKGLVRELERILGDRATWPTATVRPLFDALRAGAAHRQRSADHERVFWSLAGYLLRPGFGDPLDPTRVAALEPLYAQGLKFTKEANSVRAWWVSWRRICAGLGEPMQCAIRDSIDPFLAPDDGRPRKKPKGVRPEPFDELLYLASSLERLPTRRRSDLGAWILDKTWTSNDPTLYAALGRLGARVPTYASAHHVVPSSAAETWLSHLLRADFRAIPTVPFAAVQLSRATGDRVRDVSEASRAEVVRRLVQIGANAEWIRCVREVVVVDDAQKRELFGESLPMGLRLVS
ncbi:MAG: Hsp70 family protein [Polyangiales bacterium]